MVSGWRMGGGFAHESSGYCVTVLAAPIPHNDGITVFYRKAENFSLGLLCLHRTNVVSFHVVMVRQRWHIVGFYTFPDDASAIEYIVAAIGRHP